MDITPADRAKARAALKALTSEKFCTRVLGVKLVPYQSRVLKTVDENERTAIKACHDLGKTFLMARVAISYLNTHKNSKVITTAPTFNQVKNILWAELRQAAQGAKIPLPGQINTTEWHIDANWYAIGFSPRNEAGSVATGESTASTFQGFHAPYIMVIFDEATGIPANIWAMVEGLMTSANVKLVAIGNPTSKASEFYKCFKKRDWAKVSLTCFDSPNLQANGIFNKEDLRREIEKYKSLPDEEALALLKSYKVTHEYLLTAAWVVARVAEWGFDHPLSKSKVFGEFPDNTPDALLNLGDVELAQLRAYVPTAADRKCLGIDPARFGSDDTVFTGLHGLQQIYFKRFSKYDEVEIAGYAIRLINENGYDVCTIDETGIGGGVVTLLRHAQRDAKQNAPHSAMARVEIRGIMFGESKSLSTTPDPKTKRSEAEEYKNQKARMFGLLQKDIRNPKGLCLSNESIYAEELPLIKFRYDEKTGQLIIESKDEYKKRTGGKSPDASDSLALANLGRYDEIKGVGKFTKNLNDDTRGTLAGGYKTRKDY